MTFALSHCSFGRAPPLRSGSGCARRRQRYNCCQRRRAPCASGQRYCCCPAAPGSRPCGRASLTRTPLPGPSPRKLPRGEGRTASGPPGPRGALTPRPPLPYTTCRHPRLPSPYGRGGDDRARSACLPLSARNERGGGRWRVAPPVYEPGSAVALRPRPTPPPKLWEGSAAVARNERKAGGGEGSRRTATVLRPGTYPAARPTPRRSVYPLPRSLWERVDEPERGRVRALRPRPNPNPPTTSAPSPTGAKKHPVPHGVQSVRTIAVRRACNALPTGANPTRNP